MAFEITGKLHKKFDTENKTDTFQAREFVIETNDSGYVQYIKFQLVQDRCQLVDKYDEGQEIKVSFDLRGREWNGKFFTNLNAWKVDGAGAGNAADAPVVDDSFPSLDNEPVSGPDDDLPF